MERVGWARGAGGIGDGGPGFEGVAEDVETGGGVHGRRHGARVQRVADAEGRFEGAVGDAGFGAFGDEVEDCRAGGLAASSCRCGDGDEGGEFLVDWLALAEWSVDEVEEVGRGVVGVKVHELGGVDDASSSNGQKCIGLICLCKVNCVPNTARISELSSNPVSVDLRIIFRLYQCSLENGKVDGFPVEGFRNLLHSVQLGNILVRHDADSLSAHVPKIHSHFFGASRSKPYA